jgi:hypothetical protein
MTLGKQKQTGKKCPLQPVQYMDVKYLSECVEVERRYVRLLIRESRRSRRQEGGNVISIRRYQMRMSVMKSFQRYAYVTRLYHHARRTYLHQLAQRY